MKRFVVVPVLLLGLWLAPGAQAGPQEDVAAATAKWGEVVAENNPETISALYAKDGVLWGTLSPTVRSDPGGINAYFVGAYKALPKLTVKFGDQLIRVYGIPRSIPATTRSHSSRTARPRAFRRATASPS